MGFNGELSIRYAKRITPRKCEFETKINLKINFDKFVLFIRYAKRTRSIEIPEKLSMLAFHLYRSLDVKQG